MANNDSDNEAAQVYLLGKTYLANNQGQFYIRNDPIVQMAAGDRHTIIVTESGRAFAFGDNSSGQLGLGHTNNVERVSCIKSLKFGDKGDKVTLAACGRESSLVATSRGALYAFGSNIRSQLGISSSDSTTNYSTPVKIENFKGKMEWKQIAMGAEHACALTDEGIVYIWGSNDDGQCGQPRKVETVTTPRELRLQGPIDFIACGYYHTALIDEDGKLFLFGNNDDRQLGRSMPDKFAGPIEITMRNKVKAVACGNQHTVVLTENGEVLAAGHGDRGQIGLGPRTPSAETFEVIDSLPKHVTAVAAGEAHTAVLTARGDLYVFGDGKHGKLGSTTYTNEFEPCSVDKFKSYNVFKVACGGCQTIVLAQKKSAEQKLSSGSEEDIGNTTLSITQRPKSRARNNRIKTMSERTNAVGDSMDVTLRQGQPLGAASHLRTEADDDKSDPELSASLKSFTFNQTHTITNGKLQPTQTQSLKRGTFGSNDDDLKPLRTGALDRTARLNQDTNGFRKPTDRFSSNDDDNKPLRTGGLDRTPRLNQDTDDFKKPADRFSSNEKLPVRNTRIERTSPQPLRKKLDSDDDASSSDESVKRFTKKPEPPSNSMQNDRRNPPILRRRDDSESDNDRFKRPSPIKASMSEKLTRKARPQRQSDEDEDDNDEARNDNEDEEDDDEEDNKKLSNRHTKKKSPPTIARRGSLPPQTRSGGGFSSVRDGNQTIGAKPVDGTRASFRTSATKTLAKPNTTPQRADTQKATDAPAEQPGFFSRLFGSKPTPPPANPTPANPTPTNPAPAQQTKAPATNTNSRSCSIM